MNQEYPQNYARFYDLIYHQLRDGVDSEFFQNHIRPVRGKILEAGAGTGRFFVDALKQGADIYGIDISQSMIDILNTKLDKNQQKRISLQNITNFKFDFKFDLIIAPFRVFMHLIDKEDQLRALNNVCMHLNENGRFIFDVFIPDLQQLLSNADNVIDFEAEYEPGKKLKRIISTWPDLLNQTIKIQFHLEWDEANELKSEDWVTYLRYFFRFELEHLVERSDFRSYKILGDYNGNELAQHSKDFIIICQKLFNLGDHKDLR
jgi:SAM-dependent methyltransferase